MNSGENENTLFLSKEDEKKLIQETRDEEEDVDFIASLSFRNRPVAITKTKKNKKNT